MKRLFAVFNALALLVLLSPAYANTKEIKAYKEAFEGEKPKCMACHVDEKPKKEGPHDLNDYGKKAKALAEEAKKEAPDAETFTQLGKAPEA